MIAHAPREATVAYEPDRYESDRITRYWPDADLPKQEDIPFLGTSTVTPEALSARLPGRLGTKSVTCDTVGAGRQADSGTYQPERRQRQVTADSENVTEINTPDRPEEKLANGIVIRHRSELARQVYSRFADLLPLVGEVSLSTNLQLLKRDLSRFHELIAAYKSESNFLSIVTLVESSLSQTKWRDLDRSQLETLRDALGVGYRKVSVAFADYEDARRKLERKSIDSLPSVDLDTFDFTGLLDDEDDSDD